MWRRLLLLDLVLAALVVAGVVKIRRSWNEFEVSHPVGAITAEAETARPIPAITSAAARLDDWTEIPTKNVFSFDRTDIAVVAQREVQQPGPKPLLFGTMSIGNESIAMLSPAQGRQSRPVKIGESIENWQLVEIQKDSVVMSAGAVRATIGLHEGPREYARTGASSGGQIQAAPPVTRTVAPPPPTSAPAASSTGVPPPPANPPAGQTKGRWMFTPFGYTWIPEDPTK